MFPLIICVGPSSKLAFGICEKSGPNQKLNHDISDFMAAGCAAVSEEEEDNPNANTGAVVCASPPPLNENGESGANTKRRVYTGIIGNI